MIVRVCERASEARPVARAYVETDSRRTASAVRDAGFEARMTSRDHQSGTDRVAEVAMDLACDIVVNVQGDEPLIAPATIDAAVGALVDDPALGIATTCEPLAIPDDLLN